MVLSDLLDSQGLKDLLENEVGMPKNIKRISETLLELLTKTIIHVEYT